MSKKRDDGLLDVLAELPWWVSICVGAVVYVVLQFVLPAITFNDVLMKSLAPLAPQYSWVAAVFLLPAAVSALSAGRKRKLLDDQSGIDSIRALSWKQFEELLGEAYRRQGYSVLENSGAGPDGGVDLTIKKNGSVYLVQCKQWRTYKVGVKVVREMLGLVTAHSAQGTVIVTSGTFTQEAKAFAQGKPIDLVEGHELVDLIRTVQTRPAAAAAPSRLAAVPASSARAVACPSCGGQMVLREARRGSHAGNKFWGCSNYPKCRHVEQYTE